MKKKIAEIPFFWDATLSQWVIGSRRFGETQHRISDQPNPQFRISAIFVIPNITSVHAECISAFMVYLPTHLEAYVQLFIRGCYHFKNKKEFRVTAVELHYFLQNFWHRKKNKMLLRINVAVPNICAQEGQRNRGRGSCITASFVACSPHQVLFG
jgi:hypothetical protein